MMCLFENTICTLYSPAYHSSKTSSCFFEISLAESGPSKEIEPRYKKREINTFGKAIILHRKRRALGYSVIASAFFTGFIAHWVLPSGFNNPVYFAALFWGGKKMRKDNFLNQRNSGNRDKTAKEIKAGQVVQSRAGCAK